ncbi:hypothetical protein WS68_08855 [Burkholderia sp. TSV86]|nr:hypothetical protein WS68_08855 [Burkholderia sp. TSV86]
MGHLGQANFHRRFLFTTLRKQVRQTRMGCPIRQCDMQQATLACRSGTYVVSGLFEQGEKSAHVLEKHTAGLVEVGATPIAIKQPCPQAIFQFLDRAR